MHPIWRNYRYVYNTLDYVSKYISQDHVIDVDTLNRWSVNCAMCIMVIIYIIYKIFTIKYKIRVSVSLFFNYSQTVNSSDVKSTG